MINFKNKDEAVPSFLILFSIVVLLGSLVALLYFTFRPITVAGVAAGRQRSRSTIQKEIRTFEERATEAEVAARQRLWTGDTDKVTAAVLGQLTRQANLSGVVLTAFRPQRLQVLEGVAEVPFSLQVTGSYPKVRALIGALDRASSKLVLRSFQFASTDGASDAVTATIGLSAYFVPPTPLVATPAKGGQRG